METTTNFADLIRKDLEEDAALAAAVEDARFNANIADEIYNARTVAGRTQADLAAMTGMKQSAIARMEDADYGRHSLTSLKRIASALGKRLEVRFADTYTTMEWPHHIDVEIITSVTWSRPQCEWSKTVSIKQPVVGKVTCEIS